MAPSVGATKDIRLKGVLIQDIDLWQLTWTSTGELDGIDTRPGYVKIAIEHGHKNSEISQQKKWWF